MISVQVPDESQGLFAEKVFLFLRVISVGSRFIGEADSKG